MLICDGCGKVIANVDPYTTRYGRCAACGSTGLRKDYRLPPDHPTTKEEKEEAKA